MEELKTLSKDAYEYLSKINPSEWSRASFNEYPKCELLVNNICECFNSYILKARNKPILTLLEMIRKKLMRRYQAKREGIEKLIGRLCPRIVQKMEAIGLEAMDCITTYAGDGMFEVTTPNNKQYVVDLRRRICGCKQCEFSRIPCPHAFSAILYDYGNPEDYVDDYYTIEMYKKACTPIIYLIPSEEQWIKINHDKLEPPKYRVAPGRPKKVRKRAPDESWDLKNSHRMRKFGARMRCEKCTGLGHYKRSYPLNRSSASQLNTPPAGTSQSVSSNTQTLGKSKARVVYKKAQTNKKSGSVGPQSSSAVKKSKGKVQHTRTSHGSVIPSLVDEREHTPPPGFGPDREVTPLDLHQELSYLQHGAIWLAWKR